MTIALGNQTINFDKWLKRFVLMVALVGTMQIYFDCTNKDDFQMLTDEQTDQIIKDIGDDYEMPEGYLDRLHEEVQKELKKK